MVDLASFSIAFFGVDVVLGNQRDAPPHTSPREIEAMDIRTTLTEGVWTLRPTGELDLASVDPFRRAVRRLASGGAQCLLFDFAGLSYIDGRGIGLIYETVGRLPEDGWLGIVNPDVRILRILDSCGVSRLSGCRLFFSWEDAREACIRAAGAPTALRAQAKPVTTQLGVLTRAQG